MTAVYHSYNNAGIGCTAAGTKLRSNFVCEERRRKPSTGGQSADPSGYPDGWNNLAYVNNNVLNAVDPLGLCEEVDGKLVGCTYGFGVIRDGRGSSNTYYRTVTCGSGGLIVNVGVDGITGSTYLNGFDCGQFHSLRAGSITYRIVATSYSPYNDWHCHKTGFSKVYRGTPYLSFEIDYEYSIECD